MTCGIKSLSKDALVANHCTTSTALGAAPSRVWTLPHTDLLNRTDAFTPGPKPAKPDGSRRFTHSGLATPMLGGPHGSPWSLGANQWQGLDREHGEGPSV